MKSVKDRETEETLQLPFIMPHELYEYLFVPWHIYEIVSGPGFGGHGSGLRVGLEISFGHTTNLNTAR